MTFSTAETVLLALFAALSDGAPAGATVLRNESLDLRIPEGGLAVLRDGDPGEPEATLSPLRWHYQHQAQLEILASGETGAARDVLFDALKTGLGAILVADRTLGGLCDWVEAEAPAPLDFIPAGGPAVKAAVIPIVLHYSTSDPLL